MMEALNNHFFFFLFKEVLLHCGALEIHYMMLFEKD